MSELSRRDLVACSLAGMGLAAVRSLSNEADAAPAVAIRYNLATPNGQAMLKKYAQAVKIMRATPPSDPLSWTFQWYTHWVPGATFSPTFKAKAINTIYPPGSNPQHKALALQMWDTCQAHGPGMVEDYFLPWHRMFVCSFENIIRKVLNDNSFTLPYWNYSTPAGFPLPKEFQMQNDPVFGSLFEPKRRSVVNNGQPIFNGIGIAGDLSPAGALAKPNYSQVGSISGFNLELDQTLHGNVHVFVGTNQNMGFVPNAGGDPIFWMHHCNIDRLWASWNNAGHSNPTTAAWLNKTFVFAGPNGQQITLLVKDHTTTAKCGYRYDQFAPAPQLVAAGPPVPEAVAAKPFMLAEMPVAGSIVLGTGPVRVSLRTTAAAPVPQVGPPLAIQLKALTDNRRLYLVLKNLSAETTPEAIYRVYLDLPEGVPDDPLNSHYAGAFNFFDAAGHDEHAAHASKPYSFDITIVIANLQARGVLKPEHSVTIVPSGQPSADAKAVVGEISIVEQ
jgi:tyrosinase